MRGEKAVCKESTDSGSVSKHVVSSFLPHHAAADKQLDLYKKVARRDARWVTETRARSFPESRSDCIDDSSTEVKLDSSSRDRHAFKALVALSRSYHSTIPTTLPPALSSQTLVLHVFPAPLSACLLLSSASSLSFSASLSATPARGRTASRHSRETASLPLLHSNLVKIHSSIHPILQCSVHLHQEAS